MKGFVTIDAMGCQKEIAPVKKNQGRLEDVRDLFEGAEEFGFEHDYATPDHGLD